MAVSLSLASKMNGIVLTMTLVTVASCGFLLTRLLGQHAQFDAMIAQEVAEMDQARVMQIDFKKQVQEWKDYLLRGHDLDRRSKYKAAFLERDQRVQHEVSTLAAACTDQRIHGLLVEFREAHQALLGKYQHAMEQIESGTAWDYRVADQSVAGMDRAPTDQVDQISSALAELVNDRSKQIGTQTTGEVTILLVIMPMAILAVLATALLLTHSLSRSVRAMAQVLVQVSKGDFTASIAASGTDEIALMAQSLNQAVFRLNGILTRLVELAGTVHARASALEAISIKLSESASVDTQQATAIGSSTKEVSIAIESIASGAEEMEASIKELSNSAVQASQISTQATSKASDANGLVGRLEDSSKQIDVVLKNISIIAEQTNLLALNASIEAARAGEAGLSFRVVANEVKQLARQTASAVASTAQIMSAFQNQSKAAASAIDGIANEVTRISDILSSVASAVEEQAATTGEMSRNILGVAASARSSASNVERVVNSARTTSTSAVETRNSAQTLVQIAGELQTMVNAYKIT